MSWFTKVENAFKDLFKSTTWEQTAETTISVAAPMVETIVALAAGGPAEAAVASVVRQVQNGLAGAKAVLGSVSGTTAKAQVSSLITAVNANLATLLQDADIKNSTHAAEITAAVNGLSGELQAIIAAV